MLSTSFELALIVLAAGIAISRVQPLIWFALMATIGMDLLVVSSAGPAIHMFRLISIFSLPFWIRDIRTALTLSTVRILAAYWFYLLALGVLFGYIFPWQDFSGQRPWTQQASGRALISLSRHAVDYLTVAAATIQLTDRKNIHWAVGGLAFGLISNTGVAAYDFVAGGRVAQAMVLVPLPDIVRQGGLNFEPRALARFGVIATSVCYFFAPRALSRLAFLSLGALAIGLAQSFSAVAAAGAGTVAAAVWSVAQGRMSKAAGWLTATAALAAIIFATGGGVLPESIQFRIDSARDLTDREFSESRLTASLEVFDRAALRFLSAEPIFAIIGTGPDLVSLPASDYIASGVADIYGSRIDSVPHSGIISTVANAGVLGLILIGAFAFVSAMGAKRLPEPVDRSATIMFIAGFSALVMTPLFYFATAMLSSTCPPQRTRVIRTKWPRTLSSSRQR